jgi:hypothetical protein
LCADSAAFFDPKREARFAYSQADCDEAPVATGAVPSTPVDSGDSDEIVRIAAILAGLLAAGGSAGRCFGRAIVWPKRARREAAPEPVGRHARRARQVVAGGVARDPRACALAGDAAAAPGDLGVAPRYFPRQGLWPGISPAGKLGWLRGVAR